SFDAIIGMDRLRRHHAMIVCDEKLVRVPFGNETLVFRGAESYIGIESRLTIFSYFKVQEYWAKGHHVFLAQISATREDDKPEGKEVKDVPIVQDFPKVFSEKFPGLPPARLIEFQIDQIPGVAPVARAPYRLAPSEMKELSEQLHELSDKEPVEIMGREIKRLKRSQVPLVKVRWNSRWGHEFTWECEDSFKKKYPHLFTNRTSSSTTKS
nr:putative reverse transcriptase domain-containing protein [Tanacetum cinerariifolium]